MSQELSPAQMFDNEIKLTERAKRIVPQIKDLLIECETAQLPPIVRARIENAKRLLQFVLDGEQTPPPPKQPIVGL